MSEAPRFTDAIDGPAQDAQDAALVWARAELGVRAGFLKALVLALEQSRSALVALAHDETHLGTARLNGELDRACFQLRALAEHVVHAGLLKPQDDEAVALPPPAGRPRTTRVQVPLGPVAVFAASNFPFAFSVLGGDTASALAVGCPVVVRAHPAHPRLSRSVFELARRVIQSSDLPRGLLGLVEGDSIEDGLALVRHPVIQAVAFTGSRHAGLALQAVAQEREPPIPFFGELGSVNPVVLVPGVLNGRVDELATLLAQSVKLGMGQFCTRPGLVVMTEDEHTAPFLDAICAELARGASHPMLSPRIEAAYLQATRRLSDIPGVRVMATSGGCTAAPFMASVQAETLLSNPALCKEIFGPAVLAVVCRSAEAMPHVMAAAGGSLVHTIWGAQEETALTRSLVHTAMQLAGRVVFEGVPTGVAVTPAQQHGGPWPSSTQPTSTSVGQHACERFVRPVALQQAPEWLLSGGPHAGR
jgi:acyl-CoA reductase-like NAD-dependent aldehyde dehydrogenase